MSKREKYVIIMTPFLFFLVTFYLFTEESQPLRITYYKMVYSVTALEDLAEVNFVTHSSIITEDSLPLLIKIPLENNYNLKVKSLNFKDIRDDNNLIRFALSNCVQNEKNYIAFEIYTLHKISTYEDLPNRISFGSYSDLNEGLRYFTQSSHTVQSDNSEIKTKAYEFIYGSWNVGNVFELLNQIINFTGNIIDYKGIGDQTALSTLRRGYAVCTGKANLAVALCRSLGIPARVLFVFPTHFIAEIMIPDYGWVWGESTTGLFPFSKDLYTVQWKSNIDDENFAGLQMGGVIALWGLEGDVNATWNVEYSLIRADNNFAWIDGDIDLNKILFEKGSELWRLFCQLKNSGFSDEDLAVFSGYQQIYFESLVGGNIQNALDFAELAIAEAKRLLNLGDNQGNGYLMEKEKREDEVPLLGQPLIKEKVKQKQKSDSSTKIESLNAKEIKKEPQSSYVFDRHLVIEDYDRMLDELLLKESEAAPEEDKEVYGEARFLLFEEDEKTDYWQRKKAVKDRLSSLNHDLNNAFNLQEELKALWDCETRQEAENHLDNWLMKARASKINLLNEFADILSAQRDLILSYFDREVLEDSASVFEIIMHL